MQIFGLWWTRNVQNINSIYNSLKLPIKVRCEKFQQCSIQKSYDYEQENKMIIDHWKIKEVE